MSGFVNTRYTNTVESLVTTMKDKIASNPNYKFSDKAPTPVTYFNINKYKSTLDEAAKITFAEIDPLSGLRWNRIDKFLLYGIDNIQLSTSVEDFGIQTQEIEGECYVLPNTITPYAGDFFLISHINETLMFEITEVSPDTLENGANIYKLSYRASSVNFDNDKIKEITEDSYDFIIDNVGTDYKSVLKSEVTVLAETIIDYVEKLQEYYKNVFYSNRVQAFVYIYLNNDHFYDPYMTEFIINNKLMDSNNGDNYLYICHQTKLENMFSLKYGKTFFRALETKDKRMHKYYIYGTGKIITDQTTTFFNRVENYFQISYDPVVLETIQEIPCFKNEIKEAITTATTFKHNKDLLMYNIIIKYFNDIDIEQNDLDVLFELLDELESIDLYYIIPCIIFCLKSYILKLLSNSK